MINTTLRLSLNFLSGQLVCVAVMLLWQRVQELLFVKLERKVISVLRCLQGANGGHGEADRKSHWSAAASSEQSAGG